MCQCTVRQEYTPAGRRLDRLVALRHQRLMSEHDLGPFSDHPVLDEMANRFFRQFSRMEYALKAARFLKRNDGLAEASWTSFGDEIDQRFLGSVDKDEQLRAAYDYIMSSPPKKQMAREGRLEWTEAKPDANSTTSLLLQYVSRTRNNLFHGGKFSSGWLDPHRSEQLLGHALTVLDSCIDILPDVSAAYHS